MSFPIRKTGTNP